GQFLARGHVVDVDRGVLEARLVQPGAVTAEGQRVGGRVALADGAHDLVVARAVEPDKTLLAACAGDRQEATVRGTLRGEGQGPDVEGTVLQRPWDRAGAVGYF